jgi:hypothetical protein
MTQAIAAGAGKATPPAMARPLGRVSNETEKRNYCTGPEIDWGSGSIQPGQAKHYWGCALSLQKSKNAGR